MIFDKIELLDPDYGTVKKSSKIRKIKFKSISFKNISNLWKNFRISCLEKRLERSKDKLISMEINDQDFKNVARDGEKVADKKVHKKTKAIARLEARIEFLRTGNKQTRQFVDDRAIKLKDNMIKNMRYNCNNVYSILPEETYEERYNKVFGTEQEIEETTKKIGAEVRRIIEEDSKKTAPRAEAPVQAEETNTITAPAAEKKTITAPSTKEIREAVDEAFAAHEKATTIAEQEVKEAVNEQMQTINVTPAEETSEVEENNLSEADVQESVAEAMSGIDVVPNVSEEDVASAVEEALGAIEVAQHADDEHELENKRVSNNESTIAKVNKFINDDGTYRMKREDIDEDFRITRYNSNEQPKTMQSIIKERILVEQLKQIQEKTKTSPEQIPVVEVTPEKDPREVPVVVPERKASPVEQVKQLSAAVDEVQTMEDIQAIMASVSELQALNAEAEQRATEAARSAESLQEEKSQAVQELLDYQAALKLEYAAKNKRALDEEAKADALASEIQSIRNITGRRK